LTKGYDYITTTRRCAARLRELGLVEWDRKLNECLDSASTGGELVMGVRWELRRLLGAGERLPEDVEKSIAEIIREIDETGW